MFATLQLGPDNTPQDNILCRDEVFTIVGNAPVVQDLGAELPMRTIGMLVGIPDADQG